MRRSMCVTAGLMLAMAAAPAWADAAAEVSAADCFVKSFKAGDADAAAACYAADAVLWVPGGPMAKGTQAIRDAFAGYFAAYTVKDVTLAPLGGQTVGDDAVAWGTFTIVAVAKDTGKESTEVGRYIDVSRKIDGRWVYVADHASDDPPPEVAK